jgi:hypothetical protein
MVSRVSRRSLVLASSPALAVLLIATRAHAELEPNVPQRAPVLVERRAEPERPAKRWSGPFGPFQLGAYAGLSFPRPLSVEGLVTYDRLIGVGVEYSVLPALTISGVHMNLDAIDAELRVFPFRNGFFAGVSVGHQRFDATGSVALPMGLGSLPEEVTADTWFIGPRIGFLYTWSWGLSLGMDAGMQIPVAASFTSTVPMALPESQAVADWQHTIGKDVLPTLDLLRLGFLL